MTKMTNHQFLKHQSELGSRPWPTALMLKALEEFKQGRAVERFDLNMDDFSEFLEAMGPADSSLLWVCVPSLGVMLAGPAGRFVVGTSGSFDHPRGDVRFVCSSQEI